MHDASGKSGTVIAGGGSRTPGDQKSPSSTAAGETDEPAELIACPLEEIQVDPHVRALAREIASRMSVPKPRIDQTARRGIGALETLPYRGSSNEIDLDRTIEVLEATPMPEDEDILVRERLRTKRSVVLLVDVSGSMKGERIATAAATVGALAGELTHDRLAFIAFWSDAAVLLHLGESVQSMQLLDGILRIPASGLTNVAFPLEVAARELAGVPKRASRVILLSDCVHNAGPDPRPFAAKLPRVDVLLDATGEKDIELGREIASRGRGLCHVLRSYRDVAPALSAILRR